ncbi:hypothetical protein [Myxosarcina sp. GI1]|uniref:hypothetical protein n=1 Tax=Myxosarcina sp. GI1 TaxID=1541065 RepID=UPI0009DF1278|nr:hypothetical protein [Myxosarcina sp. GI1]
MYYLNNYRRLAIDKIKSSLDLNLNKQAFIKLYWLLFIGSILSCNTSTLAQNRIEEVIIDRQFISSPMTLEGISGGNSSAAEVVRTENTATGYCDGFVHRQPNHIFKLNSFFDFLKVEVESSADTTILIKGPGGVWCNDDAESANPMIEGQWQPGIYEVWIGSYRENANNSYRIKITGSNSP